MVMAPLRVKPLKFREDFEVPVPSRRSAAQATGEPGQGRGLTPKPSRPAFPPFFVKILTAVFHCQKQWPVLKEIELIYLDRL